MARRVALKMAATSAIDQPGGKSRETFSNDDQVRTMLKWPQFRLKRPQPYAAELLFVKGCSRQTQVKLDYCLLLIHYSYNNQASLTGY